MPYSFEPAALMPLALMLALSPVIEEVVFRSGLQDSLSRRGVPALWAVVITAMAFAAMHLARHPPAWALATVLPAFVIGLVHVRTGRLWPCIGLHALFNLIWLLRPIAS